MQIRFKICLAALLIAAWTTLPAAPVIFVLGDHPDAALYQSDPDSPYGLRMDGMLPEGYGPTYSVGTNLGGLGGQLTLTWDPEDLGAGAQISGMIERNDDGTFWMVSYSITGLSAAEDGGFKATGGEGLLSEIGGDMRNFELTGKQNDEGVAFEFDNDGHRLSADDGWVGRGWLLPAGSTNDFLVTAAVIPLPPALVMFVSALMMLVRVRSRMA